MQKKLLDNIKAGCCLVLLIVLIRMVDSIPWWSFLIPVGLFGMLITSWKWEVATFTTGFLSGLVIWVAASIYYHLRLGGSAFEKLGAVMSVPGPVVVLAAGMIGGLLTGLALYTGSIVLFRQADRSRV